MLSRIFFVLLTLVSLPLFGVSVVVTQAGEQIQGNIDFEELSVDSNQGDVILSRASIATMSREDGRTWTFRLKDNSYFSGSFDAEFLVEDGLQKRAFAAEDLSSITFDVFTPLEEEISSCPIRGIVDVSEHFKVKKPKKWQTNQTHLAKCNDSSVSLLEFLPRGRAADPQAKIGEDPRDGRKVLIEAAIEIADGAEQFTSLVFFLEQEKRLLGKAEVEFPAESGKVTTGEALLWYASKEIENEGPPVTLRYQLLIEDTEIDRGPKSDFWWFSVRIR